MKHHSVALHIYFCRRGRGGGRADGRCLRKLFIFNPVESFGLVLVFWPLKKKIKNWSLLLMFMLPTCKSRCT